MRLVYRYERHIHLVKSESEDLAGEPLWRDIEELRISEGAVVKRDIYLARAHSGVYGSSQDSSFA